MGLKIGEFAKKIGVNIQTVRYYERKKLLFPSSRMDSGYRLYDREAEKRLEFIRYSKSLGFTLKETEELLRLRVSETAECGDVKKRVEEKILEINKKMEGLKAIRKVLAGMLGDCQDGLSKDSCPILQSIEKKGGDFQGQEGRH